MIKVNQIGSVNFISKPAFKSNEYKKTIEPETAVDMYGANALASYNKAMLNNPEILDVKPLPMIYTEAEEIAGEKIYDSEGMLYSIEKEDENTKTLYYPKEDDENQILSVKVVDKKSGNIIAQQENSYDENNKLTGVSITQYDPRTKNIVARTDYEDGKPIEATKMYGNKIRHTMIGHNFETGEYRISENSKSAYRDVTFDKNKQILEVYQESTNGMNSVVNGAEFYNGSLISIDKHITKTVPNSLGIDKLNNPELTPAPKFEVDRDYKGLKGEKTYYSNDALETNIVGDVKAHFTPDGELKDLYMPDKTVHFYSDGRQDIEETLENGKTKITERCKDNGVRVTVNSEEGYSKVSIDENNRPVAYYEGVKNENGEFNDTLSLYFNKNGILEKAYEY